jgi:hypothetical protein
MTYHALLGQYMLPPTCLMASGKLVALDALLKDLKAQGSRPLIFSQVSTRQHSGACMLLVSWVAQRLCWACTCMYWRTCWSVPVDGDSILFL